MISVTKGGEAVLERCPRFGSLCVSETSTTPYTDATQVIDGRENYLGATLAEVFFSLGFPLHFFHKK